MHSKIFPIFTLIAASLSAVALLLLPYSAGVFPGGLFEDSAIGPLPLWTICSALALSLVAVAGGALLNVRRQSLPR